MQDTLNHLKELISQPGISGYETPIRDVVAKAWEPLVDELHVGKIGSLVGIKKGTGNEPRKKIMFATHMDAIGLIVTHVRGQFLQVTQVGGIDPRILPGTLVKVHSTQGDLDGVIVQPPNFTLKESTTGPVPLHSLLIDLGLQADQVAQKVKIGTPVSFAQEPVELGGGFIAGHTQDNRFSVAMLTELLKQLQGIEHEWDVYAVATSQEEVGVKGAFTQGFAIQPDIGIVVDVSFAKGPGQPPQHTLEWNKGPGIGWGPNNNPQLHKLVKEKADQLEIPYLKEIQPGMSGTDAMALQIAGQGVATLVLGLPLRYMHTAVEVTCVKDTLRTARLLAAFTADLNDKTVEKLAFDYQEKEENDEQK